MSNDLSTTSNKHLQGIYNGLIKDDEYKNLIGEDISSQKSKLKEIFTQIADNDVSSGEKAHLVQAAEKLSGEISIIEEKMEDIEKQIAVKEKEIQKKIKEIANIATKTSNESKEMEDDHSVWVQRCVSDVVYEYSKGQIGRDAVPNEIQERIKKDPDLSEHQSVIKKYLSNLNSQESLVKALSNEITDIADQTNTLRRQFGTLSSAKGLIDKTLNQTGSTNTTYTNSDYNSASPIYSLDKTAIVSGLFTNESCNVTSTNLAYVEGALESDYKRMSINEIKNKYKNYLGVAQSGNDTYSTENKAVVALGKAMNDENFISDLKSSQMSNIEIVKFLQENFANANIGLTDDGNLSVPYGHGGEASSIYTKFKNFINDGLQNREAHIDNVWDKDQGNTISSNAQIEALSENYETILKDFAKGNPPFSFKEAMYALFDSKHGLFKNSGINYDLAMQGSNPTYTINAPGDNATATLYKNIAARIEQYWGVKPYNADVVNATQFDTYNTGEAVTERTDPLTFINKNGEECAFVIDSNKDGKFSGYNEFLGASGNWLSELTNSGLVEEYEDESGSKRIGIVGSNLAQLKVLTSKYTDNASVNDGKYLHETGNDVAYKMSDAQTMGIKEIDLSDYYDFETGTWNYDKVNERSRDIFGNEKTDINDSQNFANGFKVLMSDGSRYNALRKDDTQEFMDAVYRSAAGKSFKLGLSEDTVAKVVDANYQEFDDRVKAGHKDFFNNLDLYDKYIQVREDINKTYNDTVDRMERYDSVQKTQGVQKVDSESVDYRWNSISADVRSIAISAGIDLNSEDALEQLKGIWYHEPDLSAQQVVDKYQAQQKEIKQLEEDKNTSSTVVEVLIKSLKAGIATSASEIKEIISNTGASSVDDIMKYLKENKEKQTETNNQ